MFAFLLSLAFGSLAAIAFFQVATRGLRKQLREIEEQSARDKREFIN